MPIMLAVVGLVVLYMALVLHAISEGYPLLRTLSPPLPRNLPLLTPLLCPLQVCLSTTLPLEVSTLTWKAYSSDFPVVQFNHGS